MWLAKELETYWERLPELMKDEGKFVLIQGSEVVGTFPDYAEALHDGYRRFGVERFLVKEIRNSEPDHFIPRLDLPIGGSVPDQQWFRHPEMQARIAEAEADFAAGRSVRTSTPEEVQAFLDALKSARPQEKG